MPKQKRQRGKFNEQADRFFNDVRTIGGETIAKTLDIDEATATQIANEIAHKLSQYWGGSMFYVQKYSPWVAHERDLAIWEAFNGRNHQELGKQFNLSLPYIYEILARMRKCTNQQKDLFDFSEEVSYN